MAAYREVAEWSKAHAWKVCIPQKGIEGSNPFLSAKFLQGRTQKGSTFFMNGANFVGMKMQIWILLKLKYLTKPKT